MQETAPTQLEDLPPSAKLVYYVLDKEGEMTQTELCSETRLPPRTVRHAVEELQEIDALEEGVFLQDARKRLYSAAEPEPVCCTCECK